MQGKVVFNPFGFDAFGLPTENYAMERGIPAYEVTQENKAFFIKQVQALEISFDYEKVIDTSDPVYYKRTQWIFAELFKAGLVYRDTLRVNRCPSCQTVLANDQVVEGKCERCKTPIIQKKHPQWFIKITAYADKLLADLDLIDRPEETKTAQRNWIGRSEGAEIDFVIEGHDDNKITVFTTRPDTIYGVTALVVAPEVTSLDEYVPADHLDALHAYRKTTLAKTAVQRQQGLEEKSGVFSGIYALHPLTGERIPVWFADYVLPDYATGAVMFVPAHDERDREFAKKYGMQVRQVIEQKDTDTPPFFSGEGKKMETENSPLLSEKEQVTTKEFPLLLGEGQGEGVLHKNNIYHTVEEKEKLITYAKELRKAWTNGEKFVWEFLRNRWYSNLKRRRQHPLGNYIADFYCHEYKLVLELDGPQHEWQTWYDAKRDAYMEDLWLTIVRISTDKLYEEPGLLFQYIEEHLPSPHPSPKGEGDRAYTWSWKLINSWPFDGLDNQEAKKKIIAHLETLGVGRAKVSYKLRDWSVSRQRYWGSPIPVYYDVPDDQVAFYAYQDAAKKHKDGEPTLTRQVIQVIVKDKNSDQYAWIEWKSDGDTSGFFGGIEEGEDMHEAIKRELREEGGIIDVAIKQEIMEYHCKFFHPTKQRNQYSICHAWYVEVDRTSCQEISNEEKMKHEIVRLTADEFLRISKNDTSIYVVNQLLGNSQKAWPQANRYNDHNPVPEDKKIPHLIPDAELPVVLPLDLENYKPSGKSPLEDHPTFPEYHKDGKVYRRECDTLDTFMCSSFYFLRFLDPTNPDQLVRKEVADARLPIELYTGGKEHTVGHLLYARFIHKFLYDQWYLSCPEPFQKLVHQGMVLWFDGRKMGKRYNNGIDPIEMVELHGADALRTYLMFMGPVDQDKTRNDNALHGVKKFLERIERILQQPRFGQGKQAVTSAVHQTIQGVTDDFHALKLNTVVSKLMILTNTIYDQQAATSDDMCIMTRLLAPLAPSLADRLWEALGQTNDVQYAPRPLVDSTKIIIEQINLPVQINGKMRGTLPVAPGLWEQEILGLLHTHEHFAWYLVDKTIQKSIFVPDKIINIIVN